MALTISKRNVAVMITGMENIITIFLLVSMITYKLMSLFINTLKDMNLE